MTTDPTTLIYLGPKEQGSLSLKRVSLKTNTTINIEVRRATVSAYSPSVSSEFTIIGNGPLAFDIQNTNWAFCADPEKAIKITWTTGSRTVTSMESKSDHDLVVYFAATMGSEGQSIGLFTLTLLNQEKLYVWDPQMEIDPD